MTAYINYAKPKNRKKKVEFEQQLWLVKTTILFRKSLLWKVKRKKIFLKKYI